jgi:hypothetical protein
LLAGHYAADYANGNCETQKAVEIHAGDNVSYVTPQKFCGKDGAGPNEKTSFYFRVRKPAKDVEIVLMDGKKVLSCKKRRFVNPGEIETVSLSCVELQACETGVLTVVCRQQEKAEVNFA